MASPPAPERRRAMVAREAARGIDDPRVLEALGAVPREAFVPPGRQAEAYADRPLPIGDEQTISQPYDAIVVTAGGPRVPPALVDQLAVGGRLVAPVGPPRQQRLLRVLRTPGGIEEEDLGAVAFVPLVGEQGWPG